MSVFHFFNKPFLSLLFLISTYTLQAQIGINTTTPSSILDVNFLKNSSGEIIDTSQIIGMQAPRVTLEELSSITTSYGIEQMGAFLYVSDISGGNALNQRINIKNEGYYYFDGEYWQGLTAKDDTNDAWLNDPENFKTILSTKANPLVRDANTDFIVKDNGQVAIGTPNPATSAQLDINSKNKGVLFPNITLQSNNDQTTIANPTKGLLLYNTGTGGLEYVGYVFWNGTEWRTLANNSTETGSVGNLICNNSTLSPATYFNDTPYKGTLTIPYIEGNGGQYKAQTIGPINGLTATLTPGNFNLGNGALIYTVTGNPINSTPSATSFNISIGGQICTAVVGVGEKPRIEDFAQVNFESYEEDKGGEVIIKDGSKNVARVVRLSKSVYRIDFIVPFEDTAYTVSGFGYENSRQNRDNVQPYLYIPNYVAYSSAALSKAIRDDMDVEPIPFFRTNPGYNLEVREFVIKPDGYLSYVAKFKTHFYIVEGNAGQALAGAALMMIR